MNRNTIHRKTGTSGTLLIADDDVATIRLIQATLEANGYSVITAQDGEEALTATATHHPDLVILDIMMPAVAGDEVCTRLREWTAVPVLVLSALCTEHDKTRCLRLGADDYVCKPFGLDELLARIEALLRRSRQVMEAPAPSRFSSGDLMVDFALRRVERNGREVQLTPTEYRILSTLAAHSPKALTFQMLLHKVWGYEYSDERHYLYVFITNLRRKLEHDPRTPEHLLSVREVGYRLV